MLFNKIKTINAMCKEEGVENELKMPKAAFLFAHQPFFNGKCG